MPVRFNVWFDDGAFNPCWVVTALNESDIDHPFTGQYDSFWTEGDLTDYARNQGIMSQELNFD